MERILIEQKDNEISAHLVAAENIKTWLQMISDEYQKFQIGYLDNVSEVLEDPEGYIKQQILSNMETSSHAGFAVKKELLLEQLELPDFAPIKELINKVQQHLQAQNAPSVYAFNFSEGKVSLPANYKDSITEQYSIFAETEQEIELYTALQNFRKAWKELDEVKENLCGIKAPATWQEQQRELKLADLLNIKKQFMILKKRIKPTSGRHSAQRSEVSRSVPAGNRAQALVLFILICLF